jgi:tetratricopeptide (TPR) repeat protein
MSGAATTSRVAGVVVTLLACVTVAPAVAGPAAAPPPSTEVDIAKAHFATGQAYYEHHRFGDAAREFEEAYRLSPRAPLLYNVGKSYDGANDLARALDAYRRFLDAAAADSPDRPEVQRRVQLLATLVGTVTLHGAVAGSAITVDGSASGTTPLAAPLLLNPGRHAISVSRERYATFRRSIDVPVGGTVYVEVQQVEAVKVVTVAAAPAPALADRPLYKRWWLWTAVAGAVVAAGVVTAVVLTASPSDPTGPVIQLPAVR